MFAVFQRILSLFLAMGDIVDAICTMHSLYISNSNDIFFALGNNGEIKQEQDTYSIFFSTMSMHYRSDTLFCGLTKPSTLPVYV